MQQARLAETAPDLASASIALNTSLVYVGQAVGSGIGGVLFAQGAFTAMGYVGIGFHHRRLRSDRRHLAARASAHCRALTAAISASTCGSMRATTMR